MLRCNKYCTQGDNMSWQNLVERLQEMFPKKHSNELEEYIISKNPKSAADVEHWLQQYTYNKNKYPSV
jgi:hypothetical protein